VLHDQRAFLQKLYLFFTKITVCFLFLLYAQTVVIIDEKNKYYHMINFKNILNFSFYNMLILLVFEKNCYYFVTNT